MTNRELAECAKHADEIAAAMQPAPEHVAAMLELLENLADGWSTYDDEATPSREAHAFFRVMRRRYRNDAVALLSKMGRR